MSHSITGLLCLVALACTAQLLMARELVGKCEDISKYDDTFETCYKAVTMKDYKEEEAEKLLEGNQDIADKIFECEMLALKMLNEDKTKIDFEAVVASVRSITKDKALQDRLEAGVRECDKKAELKMKIRCLYDNVGEVCFE